MMDNNLYQKFTKSTALPSAYRLTYLVPGLAAEAGEVAGKYAKYVRDDTAYGALVEDMKDELGDCLWFIAMLGNVLNISLDEMMIRNRDKLVDRQNRHALQGSGDKR